MAPTTSITVLVHEYANGDKAALDRLLPLVYAELRRIAQKHLRGERPSHTLQPTALVHEMYARLAGQSPPELRDRVHFLSVAAHVMRQILIDHARTKYAQKRGGLFELTSLQTSIADKLTDANELQQISDALDELAAVEPDLAEIVDLKFFCGFSFAEIGAMRGVSERTVQRNWEKARLYLHRAIGDSI